ncbi:MAG: DUF547 domain-containing protein [Acidobacteriota bacterium]
MSTPSERFSIRAGFVPGALVVAALAALACGLPPEVDLQEKHATNAADPDLGDFDHSALDALLAAHVDADGWVDYPSLAQQGAALDAYLEAIGAADFEALSRDAKLAFLINAYNAATLRLILDHWPLDSIRDIPADQRWDGRTWNVAGEQLTLNQIEHERIRPDFEEPRIHFAVNCASVGCPPLRAEAFTAEKLEQQLQEQTIYCHTHDRWLQYENGASAVRLTKLYDWYGGDFEQVADSKLAWAAQFNEPLQAALDAGAAPDIRYLDYSWEINSQANSAGH